MRHLRRFLASSLIGATFLSACSAPFVFGSGDLGGKTLKYAVGIFFGGSANGYDSSSFTFDSSGSAGTFEVKLYTYNFPDAASLASGDYSKEVWLQYGGVKGTFTYDANAKSVDLTPTQAYGPSNGATAIGTVSSQ